MRSWLLARWRVVGVVSGAVVIALVATIALVVNWPVEPAAEEFDCSSLEAVSFEDAGLKAAACEADIEVLGERTPWETSFAKPDGTSRLEVAAVASRTDVTGEWTDLDLAVEGTPGDGVLEVAAPVYPIEFNAGGEAGEGQPLGSIERDGMRLEVW